MAGAVPSLHLPWEKAQQLLAPAAGNGLISIKSFIDTLALGLPNGRLSTSVANLGSMHAILLWVAAPEREHGVCFKELCQVCEELNSLEDEPTPQSTSQEQPWFRQSAPPPLNGGTVYQYLGKANSESISYSELLTLWEGSNTHCIGQSKFHF